MIEFSLELSVIDWYQSKGIRFFFNLSNSVFRVCKGELADIIENVKPLISNYLAEDKPSCKVS